LAASGKSPYSHFSFRVEIGGEDDAARVHAGFQEMTSLGPEHTVVEYREGNDWQNAPRKIPGTFKVPDVTLKRGVVRSIDLYEWLGEVRNGGPGARRTVRIDLLSEDRSRIVQSWFLFNAYPIKYTGPELDAKGTEVAIEELVLSSERIELA